MGIMGEVRTAENKQADKKGRDQHEVQLNKSGKQERVVYTVTCGVGSQVVADGSEMRVITKWEKDEEKKEIVNSTKKKCMGRKSRRGGQEKSWASKRGKVPKLGRLRGTDKSDTQDKRKHASSGIKT